MALPPLGRFVLRRLALALPTLAGIAVVTFALIHLAPGDPLDATGSGGPTPARIIEAQRRLYFLDLPLFYNADPAGLGGRERRLRAAIAGSAQRFERAVREVEDCGTLCLPLLAQLRRSGAPVVRERAASLLAKIRAAHPQLGPAGASPERWLALVLPQLDPARIAARAARAGNHRAAWDHLRALGTAALPAAMEMLLTGDGQTQRRASEVVSALTGIEGRLGQGRPDAQVLAEWREWWYQQRREHVRFGSWQRAVGRVSETRFAKWVGRIATLNFGSSIQDRRPVADKLAEALPVTLLLGVLAIGIAYLVAVPLGVYAAVRRGAPVERGITVLSFLLYSLPSFWVAMVLILLLGGVGYLDWFPIYGLASPGLEQASGWSWLADRAHHLVLPVFCLSYASIAVISRYQRGAMLEVLREDYIRTARAKGLGTRAVIFKHGLRNGLLPTITLFGLHFPYLISGSVIVERIFNIPGMGLLTFRAFLDRDYPVIMAVSVISAAMTLGGLLLSDLLYAWADPRISLGGGAAESAAERAR